MELRMTLHGGGRGEEETRGEADVGFGWQLKALIEMARCSLT